MANPKPAAGLATEQRPAAPDANFRAVFESAPDAYLLLAPDPPRFTMVAANEARLRVTMTRREDVIGRPPFEVFGTIPPRPAGVPLHASAHTGHIFIDRLSANIEVETKRANLTAKGIAGNLIVSTGKATRT